MSRLRDWADSFGRVKNVVSVLSGGGVTAGSTGSETTVFFLITVVAMDFALRFDVNGVGDTTNLDPTPASMSA
jgi:hypothetical protein